MTRIKSFIKRRASLLAFIALAVVVAIAINASASRTGREAAQSAARVVSQAATRASGLLYRSQLEGCVRGNVLRREINRRVNQTDITRGVVVSFLRSAESARYSNYAQSHQTSDLKAARSYGRLAEREGKLRYSTVPIVNCSVAIAKP